MAAVGISVALVGAAAGPAQATTNGGASGGAKHVLRVKGSVFGISASGPRVAIAQRRGSCDQILLWRPIGKSGAARAKAKRLETASDGTDICDPGVVFAGLDSLLLAGQRVTWTSVGGGNIEEEWLYTRALRKKLPVLLATAEQVGAILGRGSASSSAATLVWNEWEACLVPSAGDGGESDVCDDDEGSGLAPGDVLLRNASLSVFDGTKTTQIRVGAEALTLVSFAAGRIGLMAAPGNLFGAFGKPLERTALMLFDLMGSQVANFPLGFGTFYGAAMDSDSFYTIRDKTLAVYDLVTGAITATFPAKPPADSEARFELTSVSRGIVTYLRGNSLHLVRTSDGARFKIVKPKAQRLVDAELASNGLFYAFNTGDPLAATNKGKRLGRVVFLPTATVTKRLG